MRIACRRHVGLAILVDVSVTQSPVEASMPQSSRKAAESTPFKLKPVAAAPCRACDTGRASAAALLSRPLGPVSARPVHDLREPTQEEDGLTSLLRRPLFATCFLQLVPSFRAAVALSGPQHLSSTE